MTPTTLALYVHWPWCLAKCPYCDFNAHVWEDIPREDFLTCVRRHLHETRELTGPRTLVSVFFGGGTPSLMGAAAVSEILTCIDQLWGLQADTEITVECNPTSSSAALFADLKMAGVNRVSVGVQSTRADWLVFLGRKHDVDAALKTLDAAQATIGNVNADLIFGLPKQDLDAWQSQLEQMAARELPHLSCYQLTIEPQTAFFSAVKRGAWQPMDDDRQADFLAATRETLQRHAYRNYEISNFCREENMCQHNVHIWRYGDYAGVGAGAHGRLTLENGGRIATRATKHPRNYLRRGITGETFVQRTPLSTIDCLRETLLSGLRLDDGVDLEGVESRLGAKLSEIVDDEAVSLMTRMRFLDDTGNRLRLTATGWGMLDSVLAQLMR